MTHQDQKKKWNSTKIGTTEYCFDDIPAEPATYLWLEIMETFGEAIGGILKTSGKNSLDQENDSAINEAISELTKAIKPKQLMGIIRQVLPYVFVNEAACKDGHRAEFDDFQGKTLELYKVVFFAIRYNYADFFVGALQHIKKQPLGGQDA
jgi:hypothetical protein